MPNRKTEVAMKALQFGVGFIIILESMLFVLNHDRLPETQSLGAPGRFFVILATCEIVGAILFLISRTMLLGGWILLVVLSVAAVIHILHGQFNVGTLVIYGFAVVATMAHYSDGRHE